MRSFIITMLLLVPLVVVVAHRPVLVSPMSASDYVIVDEPEVSWAYYGELTGYPHTYKLESDESFNFQVEILVPDIEGIETDRTGLIVTPRADGRGVSEVARLSAEDARWNSYYEWFGGDSYRQGPTFSKTASSGEYLVEVSAPTNEGKYVLVIGGREDFSDLGYFELLGRILEVKTFFEKPKIAIMQSPFVFVPVLLALIPLAGLGWWRYRRQVHEIKG